MDSGNDQKPDINTYKNNPLKERHYKKRRKKVILRLLLTYLVPTIILLLFLINAYSNLMTESTNRRLLSVAESQARILDIFMMERVNNILNKIDSPVLKFPLNKSKLEEVHEQLKADNYSFIDLGYFDSSGIQNIYSGPEKILEKKDYRNEEWFVHLINDSVRYIVTDIYKGLRNKPHFTIAAKRYSDSGALHIFKSSLDPRSIYENITSFEKSQDVNIYIINTKGFFQLGNPDSTYKNEKSTFMPDSNKYKGISEADIGGKFETYAFARLSGTDWIVIVSDADMNKNLSVFFYPVLLPAFVLIILLIVVFIYRSKAMVTTEYEKDIVKTQLRQAAKLAAVGELAAGIAHEIGNPLNIITNEIGMMKDYADPKYNLNKSIYDLNPNFDKINKAVFRIKDINRKMLSFVRADDRKPEEININDLINDFTSGFFERELSIRNIKLILDLDNNLPKIIFDDNQMRQVLINLLNNAADAINAPGKIFINTWFDETYVYIRVTDTGAGISQENIDKIFLPFFTTKPVGHGTGLGLSVSYSIIKSFGGEIRVESQPEQGTAFTIVMPIM